MQPLIWARVVRSPRADAVYQLLNDAERARFDRIISAIKNAPEDGTYYALTPDNTRQLQMTGASFDWTREVVSHRRRQYHRPGGDRQRGDPGRH